jgi:hypothetical protein
MGHYARECPKLKIQVIQEGHYVPDEELMAVGDPRKFWDGKAKERFPCRICHQVGHWKDECPQKGKPQRTPQERGPAQPKEEQKPDPTAEMKKLSDKMDQVFKWLQEIKDSRVNAVQGNELGASGWE